MQTVDVTGLSRGAVERVESLIGQLREEEAVRQDAPSSIFDLFGKAERLLTADEIAEQLRKERESWGES